MIQEKVQTCQFVKEKIQSKWIKVDKKQIKIKLLSMASCYSWRIYRGLGFLKNYRKGSQFSCKNGGLSVEGGW